MVNPRYYDRVTCVPQDFHGCITSVLLTAANNAGKSFFLNSLLDTVFLAHCGLPVTAEHVDLPPFDAIHNSSMAGDRTLIPWCWINIIKNKLFYTE
ncbi:hypothetical protein PCE1_002131 [Barthelona sp. PCE]